MSKKAKTKAKKPAPVSYEEPLLEQPEPEIEPERVKPAKPDALAIIAECHGRGASGKVGHDAAVGIVAELRKAGLLK